MTGPRTRPDRPAPDPAPPPLSRRDRRRNRLIAVAGLVGVWVLLWGTFTWVSLLGGLLVALVVLATFPLPPVTFAGRIRLLALLRFALRFLRDLVVASVQVAALAFSVGRVPRSAVIAVPLRIRSDLNLTLTAEAVSLVPGSLIIEVDRAAGILYVHVLGVRTEAEIDRFRRDVLDLEARIIAAIGSPAERRRIADSDQGAAVAPRTDRKGPSR